MKEFTDLLGIADRLLGLNGCPWDREQTFFTLQTYLLEETHELIEALDSLDSQKIVEELGDAFYILIFISKLGEREGRFNVSEALTSVAEKMIRRHPHVFGGTQVSSSDDVVKNWEEIKKAEKSHEKRKKIFDGIPPSLPLLARAQKMAKNLRKKVPDLKTMDGEFTTEEELGAKLWNLMQAAEKKGIDAESALRRKLKNLTEEWQG
jgi:tetrapyrrole methylase family protein/MazG family protein